MAFDPYESWLGITAVDRPRTYYHLLGLSPFESDPEIIEKAALRRMSKVRQHQIGPHSDESQEVLAELARARLVLIDPDRRADYDAKLRARSESRPDHSAVVKKDGLVDALSGAAAPARDGLEILAKLRTGDESRPDTSVAADINLAGVATNGVSAKTDAGLNVLSSIATLESDGSHSPRGTTKKTRRLWKNKLFVAACLAMHVALLVAAFGYRSAISRQMQSIFSRTDPAAGNPRVPDGRPVRTRPAPTTWLPFKRGTRITVAKSDDFDMSNHDFTIYARIKTGNSGTLFSKAPATGGWGPGAKRLYIHNGRLAFEIHGSPLVETGRQVDDEFWHDVAVTYTSKDHRLFLFIDGIRHNPRIIKIKKDDAGHIVRIGSFAADGADIEDEHFVGRISEVSFFQRALTTEEIDELSSRQPDGNLPLARWKLNEVGGKFVKDLSLHNHRGTLEDRAVPNAAMVAANDTEAVKASASFGSESTEPASGNSPPDGQNRRVGDFARKKVQEEVKADDGPEGILKKYGLKAKGQLYVAESEDDVQMTVTESLLMAGTLEYHLNKKQAALNADLRPAWINQLEVGISEHQRLIQLAEQEMNAIQNHKFRGRFFNLEEETLFNDLTVYKARLQVELNQANGFLHELKSQQANLQWNQRDEESLKGDQKAYDQALGESRDLVNTTNRKYDELKKNDEVKKALVARGKDAKKTIKLGPSPEFVKNVGELEKLERDGRRGGKRGK